MGASGTNSVANFNAQTKFVKALLDRYKISNDNTVPGIIVYGENANVIIRFGQILDRDRVKRAVDILRNPGGGNNFGSALDTAQDILLKEANGARRNVAKTLLLFTDKKNSGNVTLLYDVLKKLRDAGVKIVVVGIGNEINDLELDSIATNKDALFAPVTPKKMNTEELISKVAEAVLPGRALSYWAVSFL